MNSKTTTMKKLITLTTALFCLMLTQDLTAQAFRIKTGLNFANILEKGRRRSLQ